MSNQFPEASRDLGLPEGLARLAMPSDMIGTRTRALASHDAALSDVAVDDLPPWVDHSVHVTFIRDMGSWGCGLNALAACWDILLAKYCFPFILSLIHI